MFFDKAAVSLTYILEFKCFEFLIIPHKAAVSLGYKWGSMFVLMFCGTQVPDTEFDDEDEAVLAFNRARLNNPFIRIELLEMIYYEAYQLIKTSHPTYKNPYI